MYPPSLLLLSMDGLLYRILLVDYDELAENQSYMVETVMVKPAEKLVDNN